MASNKRLNITYTADAGQVKKTLGDMEGAHGKFGNAVSKASDGVKGHFQGMVGSITGSMGPMGSALQGISGNFGGAALAAGGMAVGVGVAMVKAAGAFSDYATDVRKVRDVSGATAEDASKLLAVMDDLAISPEQGAKAMQKFSRSLNDGSPSLDKWFSGAEQANLKGKDLNEAIPILGEKFRSLQSPIEKNAFLMDNFGKAGESMRRMMQLSKADFQAMSEQAERLGLVMSDKDIKAAQEYEFAIDDLQDALQGLQMSAGKDVIPMLTKLAEGTTKAVEATGTLRKGWNAVDEAFKASNDPITVLLAKLGNDWAKSAIKAAESTDKLATSTDTAKRAAESLGKDISDAIPKMLDSWDKASGDFDKRLDGFILKFGESFNTAATVSVEEMEAGLKTNRAQLGVFVDWMQTIGKRVEGVADKDITQAFLARLAEMGPGATHALAMVGTASDAKLKELVTLFGDNVKAAKVAADLQFDKYPANWSSKIQAANTAVFGKLGEFVEEFNAVPNKTQEFTSGMASRINSTIAEILAMQRTGAVALTPLQHEALVAAARLTHPEEKAKAIKRILDELNGSRSIATVDVHGNWTWSDNAPRGMAGWGRRHSGGMVMHEGGQVPKMHSGGLRPDERTAILQAGEFVMQKSAVKAIGVPTLNSLNSGGSIRGGSVGGVTVIQNVTVEGSVVREKELADNLQSLLLQAGQRGRQIGLS